MEKKRNRALFLTDTEWEMVKLAASKSSFRSINAYVTDVLVKQAKRDTKK